MVAALRPSPLIVRSRSRDLIIGRFETMSCPCEILIETRDGHIARPLIQDAFDEAIRIEKKYSRFLSDSVVTQINNQTGSSLDVDDETSDLLDFAARCFDLSGGLFDISAHKDAKVSGWSKISWKRPRLQLPVGMKLDLGGIGKEFAVDKTLQSLQKKAESTGILINYGGDIAASPRQDGQPWAVGIESPGTDGVPVKTIFMKHGALTTSGTTKRGGHILDPRTGQAVENAPRSVTVAAGTCSEAGFLSTFGVLSGSKAESVLTEAGVRFWCFR